MPLPHQIVVPKPESPEDPLLLFPSEHENTVQLWSADGERCAATIAACVSALSVLRDLRPKRLRFPAWRLRTWRLPTGLPAWPRGAWREPIAAALSRARSVVGQSVVRRPVTTVTVSAFAFGVVAGGSAVWLSGAARPAGVATVAPQQTPRAVLTTKASPVAPLAPVATALVESHANQITVDQTQKASSAEADDADTRPFRGSLVVNSLPSGARVFVNGSSVGETPLVLRNQTAGSRAIRIALDGYEPWSSAVRVVANSETQLRAQLRAQR
jgi:hypothetical protein